MRMRRDPRADRAVRRVPATRLRLMLAAATLPSGRPRRDPRALRQAATVAEAPRLRIAWKGGAGAKPAAATGRAAPEIFAPAIRIIEEPAFHVLVVLDGAAGGLDDGGRQLLAAGRVMADAGGGAVCAFASAGEEGLGAAGADRVFAMQTEAPDDYDPEGWVASVLAAIAALSPRHVIFAETPDGGDVARRVAARLGERLFPGVEVIENGRAIRRAGAMALAAELPRLMTVSADAFAPHAGAVHEARALEAPPVVGPVRRISDARRLAVDPDTIALAEADFLLSGGNGVTDWNGFADLAAALGATRAGSRVVCDEGHLPRERQVGASGTLVTASCYFALGISGAPQHLQGITRVRHVVAVNTDLHAEMIKRADLAIVADAQEVMPALIRLAKAREAGE